MKGFIHQAFLWHALVAIDVPRGEMLLAKGMGGMLFRFNVSPYKLLYP
ncbi:hypothetical protein [Staphylococcus coagulans]|nr:hypothetical protein [Staphylococcus coagulans]MBA8759672.1 hypothetical protein [Staphylococcus coagulans]MBA8760970.1 hypothetical protein [Staphylococcus coagulans]